jgi:hypothetical protein
VKEIKLEIDGKMETLVKKSEIQEITVLEPKNGEFAQIGKKYYFRSVTHHYVGLLVGITEKEFAITNASWVADSGLWSEAIATGSLSEIEPYPEGQLVVINRMAGCDYTEWNHELPTERK